jgi:hypothetical protein
MAEKIMGVSIRAKRRNTDIRKLSGQTVTLIEKIQQQRLSWFGHTERWNKSWQNRVGQGWATRRVRGGTGPTWPTRSAATVTQFLGLFTL